MTIGELTGTFTLEVSDRGEPGTSDNFRMAAAPGTDPYGALSVTLAALSTVDVLFRVPAGAFQPPPKVESAVVQITPLDTPLVRPDEEAPFRTLVQGAFGLRRKQMRRVVRTLFDIPAEAAESRLRTAGIDPDTRPETLGAAAFVRLLRANAEIDVA